MGTLLVTDFLVNEDGNNQLAYSPGGVSNMIHIFGSDFDNEAGRFEVCAIGLKCEDFLVTDRGVDEMKGSFVAFGNLYVGLANLMVTVINGDNSQATSPGHTLVVTPPPPPPG